MKRLNAPVACRRNPPNGSWPTFQQTFVASAGGSARLPTWGEIVQELQASAKNMPNGAPDFDGVRRKYLSLLHAKTKRAVILYASAFLEKPEIGQGASVELGDMQGFMNAVAGVPRGELDLLLTSPGGSAEATESILTYLRTRFSHIRVFVPVAAMSAATMLALGADQIVMGAHSQLGPIDPQFFISTPEGARAAPGAEILAQFERAKKECADPSNLAAWTPVLRTYAPGLLAQCVTQQQLAKTMVERWMTIYMFKEDPDAAGKAASAASWFSDYQRFGSHGRSVTLPDVKALGLNAVALEEDHELQDLVLSVHHATAHTFSATGAVKIIENHQGKAFVRMIRTELVRVPSPKDDQKSAGSGPSQMNRAARRRQPGR
jgi:hypothetical protein